MCTEATPDSMMEQSGRKDGQDCARLRDLVGLKYLTFAGRSERAFFGSYMSASCLFQELDQHQLSLTVKASIMITFLVFASFECWVEVVFLAV